jgi:hypothetical protein
MALGTNEDCDLPGLAFGTPADQFGMTAQPASVV